MAVATGRTRVVSISGSGSAFTDNLDPTTYVNSPDFATQTGKDRFTGPVYAYLGYGLGRPEAGNHEFFVHPDYSQEHTTEHQDIEGVTYVRFTFWLKIRVNGPYGSPVTVVTETVQTPWLITDYRGGDLYFTRPFRARVEFSFTGSLLLTEYADAGALYETGRHTGFAVHWSASAEYTLGDRTQNPATVHHDGGHYTVTGSGDVDFGSEGSERRISSYEKAIYLHGIGLYTPNETTFILTGAGLSYTASPFNFTDGWAKFSGNADTVSLEWTGNATSNVFSEGYWEDASQAFLPIYFQYLGKAEVHLLPAWAMQIDHAAFHYEDGAAEDGARLDHTVVHVPTGASWTIESDAAVPLRSPGTGTSAAVSVSIDDGLVILIDPYGVRTFRHQSADPVPATRPGLINVLFSGQPLLVPAPASNAALFLSLAQLADYQNFYAVSRVWADEYGLLADSSNWWPYQQAGRYYYGPGRDAFSCGARGPLPELMASVTFDATHRFALLDDVGTWHAYTAAQVGTGYSELIDVTAAGDALKFRVTAAGQRGLLSCSVPLKHFGYRYAKLRVRASAAGAVLRFGLGYVGAAVPQQPLYAWTVTTGGADEWSEVELDLAAPELLNASMPAYPHPAVIAWQSYGELLHPAAFYPDPPNVYGYGAVPFLELLTAGIDYEIEYLEGYRKTDGDRKPILGFYPLMVFGDLPAGNSAPDAASPRLLGYETSPPTRQYWYPARMMLFVVNGVRAFCATYGYYWAGSDLVLRSLQDVVDQLDDGANDTGIHLTAGPAIGSADPDLALNENGTGLARELSAGTSYDLNARVPLALSGANVYYGMGTPGGSYDAVLHFTLERVLDGEVLGNAFGAGKSRPGVQTTLVDNDSGTVVATASSDDDGLFRLAAKYGVWKTYSNAPVNTDWWSDLAGHKQFTDPGFGQPGSHGWTATGKRFNSYWLKGDRLRGAKDAQGYLLSGTDRYPCVVLDRWPNWLDFAASGTPTDAPGVLITKLGVYFRVDALDGVIWVHRATFVVPPFEAEVPVAFAAPSFAPEAPITSNHMDRAPAIDRDGRERLWVVFVRDDGEAGVYVTYSDDEGDTWTVPTSLIPGGDSPRVRKHPTLDAMIVAAPVAGQAKAVYQGPGDAALGEIYTFADENDDPLALASGSGFDLTWAPTGESRLVGAFHLDGDDGISEWWSADEGHTWMRVAG